MENVDILISFITALLGLATTVITEYKGNVKKQNKEDYYYRNLLKPFVKAYINKKDIDAVAFVKESVKRDDDNIPKYIYYLLEKEDPSLLKILIYDYSNLYQNEENRMSKALKNISKFLYYFLFLLSLIMLFFGAYAVTMDMMFVIAKFLQLIIEGFTEFQKGWNDFLRLTTTAFICLGGSYLTNLAIRELNYDRYTIKKRKIKKFIESSVKIYDRNIEKVVL